nr:OFA family MFS transporter [uncultured Holophaga sp.]
MTDPQSRKNHRWLIPVMGTLLQLALGTEYAWSYFQKPIMASNHWTNSQAAWAFGLAILSVGFAAAWAGMKLPKYGPRYLAMVGGLLFGAGYLIASYALKLHSLPLFYLGYGLVGGCGLGLGYVVPVATAAKWFPEHKGAITGMVVMGFGLGALVMSKLLAPALMAWTGRNLVQVFASIGVIMLVVAPLAGFFMVNPPSAGKVAGAVEEVSGVREALLSGRYIKMWVLFFLNINAGIMFIGFQSPLLQDLLKRSMDPATLMRPAVIAGLAASGATLIAISSIFNGVGRFLWGGLSDRIGRTRTFRWILGSQCVAFIVLLFVNNPIVFSILVCYVILCYGGGFGSMPGYVGEVFGAERMPVLYGTILTAWGLAGVTGPQVVAFLKDHMPAKAAGFTFVTGAAMLLVGVLITLFLNDGKFVSQEVGSLQVADETGVSLG